MRDLVCAVDVGTTSARAGIFDRSGALVARAEHPIVLSWPEPNHAEHDSEDIWRACCRAVQAAREKAKVTAGRIAGIAFDATCSLVIRGEGGKQISISRTQEDRWDTISWLDHRALAEADECTASGHPVLDYVGGVMSPEMQTPKLMWLKRHHPTAWQRAHLFFDLSDFLAWKACGTLDRSQCALTGKWTFMAHAEGWRRDFFASLGIADLLERGDLPPKATPVGTPVGRLSEDAARDLTLDTGCVVGTGLIDAFAGTLGVIGAHAGEGIDRHLALITGTSSCVMGLSREPRLIPSVWGPYFGATLPDYWLVEGGQSASGALLDHVIRLFGMGRVPDTATHKAITARILAMRSEPGADLGDDIHVLADFHGNRSPLGEPRARGSIYGLTLDTSFDGLCRVYWRTAVAIALGVRHILQHFNAHGFVIDTLHVTGGHTRSPLLMELYADATACTLSETTAEDAVLLGTGMVAATAAGWYPTLADSCRAMQQPSRLRPPNPERAGAYERDYRIFLKMHEQRRDIAGMV